MVKSALVTAGVIGGVLLGGTALATGQHDYNKNKKPCELTVTDSPRIHNPHCKPSPTPVITPKVTSSPTPSPVVAPNPRPSSSPKPTPAATEAVSTPTSKIVTQPTTLPSVGAKGHR